MNREDHKQRDYQLGHLSTFQVVAVHSAWLENCSAEVLTTSHGWGTATDRNFGVNEGTVVCRQLGCQTSEVQRTNTRE